MMYIIAPKDTTEPGGYERAHWTCLIGVVSRAGIVIMEGEGLNQVLPRATGYLLLGDTSEDIWAGITGACIYCGQGDADDVNADDVNAERSPR